MDNAQTKTTPEVKIVPLMFVLILGAFVTILNQTLLNTALPPIKDDLGVDTNTVQWLTTVFMLVNGVMIPITAFLIDKFTTRGLFLTAMGLFAIGTLIGALAPSFPFLVVARVVQAAGAGIMMPLTQTIFFIVFPIEKRGTAMGLFGLVIAFAPAIGPSLSGYLVDQYPWRVLFYVVLPIAIIDIIFAYFLLKNVTTQKNPKVDIQSIVLSTLGFGGLLYGFGAAADGWGRIDVILTIVIGVVSLLLFIRRQFRLENPILEFRVFKYKIFTIATVLGMMVFISMIGGATILPIYMQDMHHFTALESGLMLLPGAIIMGLMNPVTGWIFDRVGGKWLAIVGLTIVTISTFMFTVLTSTTSFTYLAIFNALRMFGISMVMMPVTTAGLNQLPVRLIPHGTAMNNTMRQVAGSVGTALIITISVNAALNPAKYGDEGLIHGVNIAFMVAGVISAICIVLAFFLKKTSPEEE